MPVPAEIFCDNDLPIAVGPLQLKSFTTGALTLGTGLTVRAMLCAVNTVAATPINEALRITLTEVGSTGEYFGGWDGAVLTTHLLPTYKDAPVWVIVYAAQDFRVAAQTIVREARLLDDEA